MTDQPPESPPVVARPLSAAPDGSGWSTISGVGCITVIAIAALLIAPKDAHDIALSAVSILGGWLGHKAVQSAGGGQ